MPELEKRTIYDISVTGSYRVEGKSPQDALNKAKEYFENDISKLTFNYHEQEVWVEVGE